MSWPCEKCTHDIIMTLITKDENKNDHGATHDSVIGARGACVIVLTYPNGYCKRPLHDE